MPTSLAYTLYAAKIGASTLIDQMENQDFDSGIEQMLVQANGQLYSQFIAIGNAQPRLRFASSNLVAILGQGLLGYPIGSGQTNTTAVFYWRQLQNLGSFKSGNVQQSMTMNSGIILPRSISARTGERATVSMEVIPVYNGTNLPFVIANNVALPAGTPTVSNIHTSGPVVLNGVSFKNVTDVEIDLGINETLLRSDGDAYNSFLTIPRVNPTISFTTYDLSAINALGQASAITAATVYFVRVQPGGTRYAYDDVGNRHLSASATAGMVYVESASAQTGEVGSARVKMVLSYDGSNAPITFNTGTVITLP